MAKNKYEQYYKGLLKKGFDDETIFSNYPNLKSAIKGYALSEKAMINLENLMKTTPINQVINYNGYLTTKKYLNRKLKANRGDFIPSLKSQINSEIIKSKTPLNELQYKKVVAKKAKQNLLNEIERHEQLHPKFEQFKKQIKKANLSKIEMFVSRFDTSFLELFYRIDEFGLTETNSTILEIYINEFKGL